MNAPQGRFPVLDQFLYPIVWILVHDDELDALQALTGNR
jgi:hypothetical protein